MSDGYRLKDSWRSETAGGCPLKRCKPLTQVGLPLDYARPEPSRRHTLPPSGPRPGLASGAVPSFDSMSEVMKSDDSLRDVSQNHPEGYAMSSIDQPDPNYSSKHEPRRTLIPSSRLHETGPLQPRMVRLTVSLPGDLVDRLRNAVYWSPSLKLSWVIAQSLRTALTEMESSRQGPFPQRINPLRAGRPRMVGQTMKVFSRARLTRNGAARSAEGVSRATLVPPSVE